MNDVIIKNDMASVLESVIAQGDLSKLSPEGKVFYYKQVCESIGLNPLTKPFDYISLSGKLVLYARKDATDQLRSSRGVSVYRMDKELVNDVYTVTAYGKTADGRTDVSTGSVFIGGKRGDELANAMMKAETKAKRRMTLSICGLGFLDETEIETIPDARIVPTELPGNPIPAEHDGKAPIEQVTRDADLLEEYNGKAPIAQAGNGNAPSMTVETAMNVMTTEDTQRSYGSLTDKELNGRRIQFVKQLKENNLTSEEKELKQWKLSAVVAILNERAKSKKT